MQTEYYEVTKTIEFDAGHRVPYHDSHCRNVHGHRYKLEATLSGPLVLEGAQRADEGMVLDFKDLKNALVYIHSMFDHKFIVCMTDPLTVWLRTRWQSTMDPCSLGLRYLVEDFGWVQEVPGVPTAENLAFYCFSILVDWFTDKAHIRVESVRLWETPTSMAEYKRPAFKQEVATQNAAR